MLTKTWPVQYLTRFEPSVQMCSTRSVEHILMSSRNVHHQVPVVRATPATLPSGGDFNRIFCCRHASRSKRCTRRRWLGAKYRQHTVWSHTVVEQIGNILFGDQSLHTEIISNKLLCSSRQQEHTNTVKVTRFIISKHYWIFVYHIFFFEWTPPQQWPVSGFWILPIVYKWVYNLCIGIFYIVNWSDYFSMWIAEACRILDKYPCLSARRSRRYEENGYANPGLSVRRSRRSGEKENANLEC